MLLLTEDFVCTWKRRKQKSRKGVQLQFGDLPIILTSQLLFDRDYYHREWRVMMKSILSGAASARIHTKQKLTFP